MPVANKFKLIQLKSLKSKLRKFKGLKKNKPLKEQKVLNTKGIYRKG